MGRARYSRPWVALGHPGVATGSCGSVWLVQAVLYRSLCSINPSQNDINTLSICDRRLLTGGARESRLGQPPCS